MLEQLIESKSNTKQAANRMGFLFSTFTLVAGLCLSGVLWSLFAMNVGIGDGEFDLTALIAPVSVVENKPEPIQKEENQTQENNPTRRENILRMEEQPTRVPDTISVTPNTQKARPVGKFDIGKFDKGDSLAPRSSDDESPGGGGGGVGEPIKSNSKDNEDDGPALIKPTKKDQIARSGGAIMSKVIILPKPAYSQAAKAIGADGPVSVEIFVDERGNVISAKAVSGHGLLRAPAENAARKAKFTPTYLSGQAVKATGLIVYNFVKN